MTTRHILAIAGIAFALAGCSPTSPAAEQRPSSTAKPIPARPTEAQIKDLVSRVAPIAPKIAPATIASKSRYVCSAILQGGSQKALTMTATKHFETAADPVSADEAVRLVAAVKANGFCK